MYVFVCEIQRRHEGISVTARVCVDKSAYKQVSVFEILSMCT